MRRIILIGSVFLLLLSCDLVEPEANVRITDWTQDYDEFQEIWSGVGITYKITNDGNLDIKKYKVYFSITCEGGNIYSETDEGYDIPKDYTVTDYIYIYTDGERAIRVDIDDYTLLE